jgi:hypothetical protein
MAGPKCDLLKRPAQELLSFLLDDAGTTPS